MRDQKVTQFVRQVLGCGCPDHVFESIEESAYLDQLAPVGIDATVLIGAKLLVLFCRSAAMDADKAQVALERARAIRDEQDLNRVRLVVAQSCWSGGELTPQDERLHLHVVSETELSWMLTP